MIQIKDAAFSMCLKFPRQAIKENAMLRVAMLLYSILGASLAGTFMIVALVIGQDTARPIIISAVLGFVAAIPLALVVAKKLTA